MSSLHHSDPGELNPKLEFADTFDIAEPSSSVLTSDAEAGSTESEERLYKNEAREDAVEGNIAELEQPPSRGRTPVPTVTHRRPSSVPAKPLKSAFARLPHSPRPELSHFREKKSAHFDVRNPTIRSRAVRRTRTAPADMEPYFEPVDHVEEQAYGNYDDDAPPEPFPDLEESDEIFEDGSPDLEVDVQVDVVDQYEDAETAKDHGGEVSVLGVSSSADKDHEAHSPYFQQRLRYQTSLDPESDTSSDSSRSESHESEASADDDTQLGGAGDELFEFSELQRQSVYQEDVIVGDSQRRGSVAIPELPVILEDEPLTSSPDRHYQSAFEDEQPASRRRVSDPEARLPFAPIARRPPRRSSSMNDFWPNKERIDLLPFAQKAEPAHCATTYWSVKAADSPKLHTVYEHPNVTHRHTHTGPGEKLGGTAQTVCSGNSTYEMLWEDDPPTRSGSTVSLVHDADDRDVTAGNESWEPARSAATLSPMGRVKHKLAAWSFARQQEQCDDDGDPQWVPLMAVDDNRALRRHSDSEEDPAAPPNTAKNSGVSSTKHSTPHVHSENQSDNEDVEDLSPEPDPSAREHVGIRHRVRAHSASPSVPRLSSPLLHRTSSLSDTDERFRSHRDSVELSRCKLNEGRVNNSLMSAQDSFYLTRSKYNARYPKTGAVPVISFSRFGELEPILDASPPDAQKRSGRRLMERATSSRAVVNADDVHPDEHVGCAIFEVDRPRWYGAHHGRRCEEREA